MFSNPQDRCRQYAAELEDADTKVRRLRDALVAIRDWALTYRYPDGSGFEEDKDIPFGLANDALERP